MSERDALKYLDNYRTKFQEYSTFSDVRLYNMLRADRDENLPEWNELDLKMGYSGAEGEKKDTSAPSHVNGIAHYYDYWIDEGSPEWMKAAYNQSLTGITEELVNGKQRYNLDNYDPGIIENILSGALSFLMPLDLATMWIGGKAAQPLMRAAGLGAKSTAPLVKALSIMERTVGKQGAKAAQKYLLKSVPTRQAMIQSATTLGLYEGARGGMETALDPEADASDIFKGVIGGLGNGIFMGTAIGFVGGGLLGKRAWHDYAKADKVLNPIKEKLFKVATGVPAAVVYESAIFTGLGKEGLAHQALKVVTGKEREINWEDLRTQFLTNLGMFGIMKAQHHVWGLTKGNVGKVWETFKREKLGEKESKETIQNKNSLDNVKKDFQESTETETDAVSIEKQAELTETVNVLADKIAEKHKIEKGELRPGNLEKRMKEFEAELNELKQLEIDIRDGTGTKTEMKARLKRYSMKVDEALSLLMGVEDAVRTVRNNHKNKKSQGKHEIIDTLGESYQKTLTDLQVFKDKFNDLKKVNENVRDKVSSQHQVAETTTNYKEMRVKLKKLRKKAKKDKDKEEVENLDNLLEYLENWEGRDIVLDQNGVPRNIHKDVAVTAINEKIEFINKKLGTNAGITKVEEHVSEKKFKDIEAEQIKIEKEYDDIQKQAGKDPRQLSKLKKQWEGKYTDKGVTMDRETKEHRRKVIDTYKDIEQMIETGEYKEKGTKTKKGKTEKLTDKQRTKLKESLDFLKELLFTHEGSGLIDVGDGVRFGRHGQGSRNKPMGRAAADTKARQYRNFVHFLAIKRGKSIREADNSDIRAYALTTGKGKKYSAIREGTQASMKEITSYIQTLKDRGLYTGKKENLLIGTAIETLFKVKGTVQAAPSKMGLRTGEATGKESVDVSTVGEKGFYTQKQSKSKETTGGVVRKYIVGKLRKMWDKMLGKSKEYKEDDSYAGQEDFLIRGEEGFATTLEAANAFVREFLGVRKSGLGGESRRLRNTQLRWALEKFGKDSIEYQTVWYIIQGRTSTIKGMNTTEASYLLEVQGYTPKQQKAVAEKVLKDFMNDIKKGYARNKDGNKILHKKLTKKEAETAKHYTLKEIKDGFAKIETDGKGGWTYTPKEKQKFLKTKLTKETMEFTLRLLVQAGERTQLIFPTSKDVAKLYREAQALKSKEVGKHQLEMDATGVVMDARHRAIIEIWAKQTYPIFDVKFRKKMGDVGGRDILGRVLDRVIEIAEGKAKTDTLPHEIAHEVISMLEAFGTAKDKRLINEAYEFFRVKKGTKKAQEAYERYADIRKKDVKKLTFKEKSEALKEATEEAFIQKIGEYTANQITNKTMFGRIKAWIGKFWFNVRDAFGLRNYADAQKVRKDLVFMLGEKVYKGGTPLTILETAYQNRMRFQLGEKLTKEEYTKISGELDVLNKELKAAGYTNKELKGIMEMPISEGGLGLKKFPVHKNLKLHVDTLQLYKRTLQEYLEIKQQDTKKTHAEVKREQKVRWHEEKYNVNPSQRKIFFEDVYHTPFHKAGPRLIKSYLSWIEKSRNPVENKLSTHDNLIALTKETNPGLKLWQRAMMPTSHVLINYGGKAGEILGYKMLDYDVTTSKYRGIGEDVVYNIEQLVKDGGGKDYLWLLDRQRAIKTLNFLKKNKKDNKYLEKQYVETKKQYDKFWAQKKKDRDSNYESAKEQWKEYTDFIFEVIQEKAGGHFASVKKNRIKHDIQKKYVDGYFTRRLTKKASKHLTQEHKYIKNLVEENIELAAEHWIKKNAKSVKPGTVAYKKLRKSIIKGTHPKSQDIRDSAESKIFDIITNGPTEIDPSFMKDRGLLMPEFMEITNARGGTELIRTYETKDVAIGYARGISKYIAMLEHFPEFTKVISKGDTKSKIVASLGKGGTMGDYALKALNAELGITDISLRRQGSELKWLSTITSYSAAFGLSSPMSGIKNLLIQIPRSVAVYGLRNTWKAMSKAGWHPWFKSGNRFWAEARKKGQLGYGTAELVQESPWLVKTWFNKVNQMTQTENFNRIVTAEAGTLLFGQMVEVYHGKETMFKSINESKVAEIERMFKDTWKLDPKQIDFIKKMDIKDFSSEQYRDILFKVGHYSHVSSAGGTSTAMLPLWMSGKIAKPLTLFQRIAASVTWDSYQNYIKPMKNGNYAPILKAAIGHAVSGAVLYQMFDSIFDIQPPKEDEGVDAKILNYLWRGEFFGVFGEIVTPYEKRVAFNPIMEPVILRNFRQAGEEFVSFYGGHKTFGRAVRDWSVKSVVLFSQLEKLKKSNRSPYDLGYDYETKRKRIKTLEGQWRIKRESETGIDYSRPYTAIGERGQFSHVYFELKEAIYSGDENLMTRKYYAAFNSIVATLEPDYPDLNTRIKVAETMINQSVKSLNALNISVGKPGLTINKKEQFLLYLSPENRKLALQLEKDFEMIIKKLEKVRRDPKIRRQHSVYPLSVGRSRGRGTTRRGPSGYANLTNRYRTLSNRYGGNNYTW